MNVEWAGELHESVTEEFNKFIDKRLFYTLCVPENKRSGGLGRSVSVC